MIKALISFTSALVAGWVCFALQPSHPLWPSFTRDEAASKLGRRVRLAGDAEDQRVSRCPSVCNRVEFVKVGDRGTVVGMEPWPEGISRDARACRVWVRWDDCEQGENCRSLIDQRKYQRMLSEE